MTWLGDAVIAHLCTVADWPDVTGTRYELLEKIGQGGMGSVFLARDLALDRPVALKVLRMAPGEGAVQARMKNEARIVARLEHPSIVPIHDAGTLPDGRFFYAMKLVRGKRLDDAAALPEGLAERLHLFLKICDAVAFAHANGVLHRDLKPQNIMLGPFGEVLVLDWGLAKETARSDPHGTARSQQASAVQVPQTDHGTVLGTPGYMAPEQARGEPNAIDERTDVHALGALLSFLLEGLAISAPRAVRAIVWKAMAPRQADRYAGAKDLKADVGRFLARDRVSAYPDGLLGATMRTASKYRTPLALVGAYLIMRLLLLIWM